MKPLFFLTLVSLALTSCKSILLSVILKDPKVENTASIKAFQAENQFSIENSLILKGDTASVERSMMLGLGGYRVFNKAGEPVCYSGSATCTGTQFYELMKNQKDSFQLCDNLNNLQDVLNQTYNLNEQPVFINQFPKADYYIVAYWNKFLGGKRGYEDAILWMENEIKKDTSDTRFTMIKINADMQESWGLATGGKAKLKWKKNGDKMSLQITDIPAKN